MRCPHCNGALDVSRGFDPNDRPEHNPDNAASICWECLEPGIFARRPLDGSVFVRKPTPEELESLLSDPGYVSLLQSLKDAKATGRGPREAAENWRKGTVR